MCVCICCKPFCCVFLCRHSFGGLHGHHWCLLVLVAPCRLSVQNALSRSYNSNNTPLSRSLYSSCRDMHASQESLVFSARDGQPYGALGFCVSTLNVKLAPAAHAGPGLPVPASFTSFRRWEMSISFSPQCWEVITDPHSSFTCPFIGKWKYVSSNVWFVMTTNPVVHVMS